MGKSRHPAVYRLTITMALIVSAGCQGDGPRFCRPSLCSTTGATRAACGAGGPSRAPLPRCNADNDKPKIFPPYRRGKGKGLTILRGISKKLGSFFPPARPTFPLRFDDCVLTAEPSKGEPRISLRLDAVPVPTLMRLYKKLTDRGYVVDAGPEVLISGEVRDMPADDALVQLLASVGFARERHLGGRVLYVGPAEKLAAQRKLLAAVERIQPMTDHRLYTSSYEARDRIDYLVHDFDRHYGVAFRSWYDVSGEVRMDVYLAPWEVAAKLALRSLGYWATRRGGAMLVTRLEDVGASCDLHSERMKLLHKKDLYRPIMERRLRHRDRWRLVALGRRSDGLRRTGALRSPDGSVCSFVPVIRISCTGRFIYKCWGATVEFFDDRAETYAGAKPGEGPSGRIVHRWPH